MKQYKVTNTASGNYEGYVTEDSGNTFKKAIEYFSTDDAINSINLAIGLTIHRN
jgi:hypothetical protein